MDDSSLLTLLFLLGIVLVVAWGVWRGVKQRRRIERRIRALDISRVDLMSGREFENYVARLLQHQGKRVQFTPDSGDLGVDLIAVSNGTRTAIQCKRHGKSVSRRAISDAVAGKTYYKCSEAQVVTNSLFTKGARTLAQSNGCELVDRSKLTDWILDFQGKQASETQHDN